VLGEHREEVGLADGELALALDGVLAAERALPDGRLVARHGRRPLRPHVAEGAAELLEIVRDVVQLDLEVERRALGVSARDE